MGFESSGVIKGVLYNKDGTVDYVFDDVKLNEVIAPFVNEDSLERVQKKVLFLSSSKDSKNVSCLLVILCWYDWWNGDKVEYNFEVNI